jgi:hypothetical protein
VQAVEGEHQRAVAAFGQLLGPAVGDLDVGQARLCHPGTGALDGQTRELVPVERRPRKGLGQGAQRHPRPAPDIRHKRPRGEPVGHPLKRRQDRGHEAETCPGAEHPLSAMHPLRAVAIVGQPGAGAKGIGQLVHQRRLGRGTESAGRELQALLLAREHQGASRGQLELLPIVGRQQVGRRVAPQPLAQPARVAAPSGRPSPLP